MILKAVIVKSKQSKINSILKNNVVYATDATPDNISRVIRFYKTEAAAQENYHKTIAGVIHIVIDTDNMEFLGENETPILLTPKFAETDSDYIFTFEESIKDLHYKLTIADYYSSYEAASPLKHHSVCKPTTLKVIHMTEELIQEKMKELAALINYSYIDLKHLTNAMHCQIIHKQRDGKNRKNYTNDSYATLGDAILKFVLTEYLFDRNYDKNQITEIKKDLEKNTTLFDLCNESGIFQYAYNDKYFSTNAPRSNQVHHSKHDVYIEAIIAAIYQDKGFDYCKEWIISFFKKNALLD